MADHVTLLADNRARYIAELRDFVRIPSISSLPDHQDDVRRAADWIRDRLTQAGLEYAEVLATGAQPVVYADHLHAPGAPTILIYGHFDVQPAIRADGWSADPFDPVLADDCVYGRGSSDDKGAFPKDRPVRPQDVLATMYRHLGVDTTEQYEDFAGRPHPVLPYGEPIEELF